MSLNAEQLESDITVRLSKDLSLFDPGGKTYLLVGSIACEQKQIPITLWLAERQIQSLWWFLTYEASRQRLLNVGKLTRQGTEHGGLGCHARLLRKMPQGQNQKNSLTFVMRPPPGWKIIQVLYYDTHCSSSQVFGLCISAAGFTWKGLVHS